VRSYRALPNEERRALIAAQDEALLRWLRKFVRGEPERARRTPRDTLWKTARRVLGYPVGYRRFTRLCRLVPLPPPPAATEGAASPAAARPPRREKPRLRTLRLAYLAVLAAYPGLDFRGEPDTLIEKVRERCGLEMSRREIGYVRHRVLQLTNERERWRCQQCGGPPPAQRPFYRVGRFCSRGCWYASRARAAEFAYA
jgi:hypothetical protein